MNHPILSGRGINYYLLVWGVVIFVHFLVLFFYLDLGLLAALADSLIYNSLFALLGIGFWYVVTYASLNRDEIAQIAMHFGAATITLLIWITISGVLAQLFSSQYSYEQFSDEAYIWRWIIGLMLYSITVLIFYLIKYYRDMKERLGRENELQTLLKDAELRMLKSQINPHFIFNSLNSVSALTMSKPEDAREMVIKLSDFLRYSLGKDNSEMNTLEQEIKNITLYLDIEKVRFGDRLIFENEVSEECLKVKVPNLILQPLVENAIKYGVYESTESVTIKLSCESKEEMLHLVLTNSYEKEAVSQKGEGIGLENVKKRLNLVYGGSDLLIAERGEDQFSVKLKIPKTAASDE